MRTGIRTHGFTLLELLVVILIIGILAGLLLPALAGARRTSRELKNTTQVKNIQGAMVQYADRNGEWYPGFNADGVPVNEAYRVDEPASEYDTPQKTTAALIYWQILKEGLLAPDGLVSPLETENVTVYGQGDSKAFEDPNFSAEFAARRNPQHHYSFAVLDPNVDPNGDGTDRKRNFRNNANGQAVIASDRATAVEADADGQQGFTSIHSFTPGKWRGTIAWNDGRAGFQESPVVSTRYTQDTPSNADNIFFGKFTSVRDNQDRDDAFMMWNLESGRDVWFNLRDKPYVSP